MSRAALRFVYLLLFAMLLYQSSSADGAGALPQLTVRETGAGLYAQQDGATEPIARLEKGEVLVPMIEAIGRETWYIVRTRQGLIGWVRAADVIADSQTREMFKEKQSSSSFWSARTADGRAFNGTWQVMPDSDDRSASGDWTLTDAGGAMLMRGRWSADKHETGWNGVWRASVDGGKGEYNGSWSSGFPHTRNATFADLFAAAAKDAMTGLWTGGSTSGSWSIRAAQR